MTWTYSGDPSNSELDEYRFYISDTNQTEQLLQDEEIKFVLDSTQDKNQRLTTLFERIILAFSRLATVKKLGPQREEYKDRMTFFKNRHAHYKAQTESTLAAPTTAEAHSIIFTVGMNDNPGANPNPLVGDD